MSNPLQGGIYRWPEVSSNHPMGTKSRMWVVVSRDSFNQHGDHVLACPLTSYPPKAVDIAIRKTPHLPLDHDSALLPRMITPILKAELGVPLGRVTSNQIREVADKLRILVEVD